MVRRHLPEERESRLVGEDHLPRWLDHPRRAGQEMLAERFTDDPLPGVELEQRFDGRVVEVKETYSVPADVFDRDARGVEARLDRGVAKIIDRALIFSTVFDGGEVDAHGPEPELFPGLDQLLVDGIELVAPWL